MLLAMIASTVFVGSAFAFTPSLEIGSNGIADGEFSNPSDVYVDTTGNIFVVDSGNDRIQRFDSTGTHLETIGSFGSGSGQFSEPSGIFVDNSGNLFVADTLNSRIVKLDSTGNQLLRVGVNEIANGEF